MLARRRAVVVVLLAGLALAACTSSSAPKGPRIPSREQGPGSALPSFPPESSPAPASSAASAPPLPPPSAAKRALDAMSLTQRVGQLLMVGVATSEVTEPVAEAIQANRIGSVILDGTTRGGAATIRKLTAYLRNEVDSSNVGMFIATDQEGGTVQRLQGPGFSTIPSALIQGQESPDRLRAAARGWGRQLRQAGLNLNLAPVLDTVPAGGAPNPPIGDLDREYGDSPDVVGAHGVAFAQGMSAAGVDATVKHFPGLGRVTGNTDTSAGVTDRVTTRDDPYLAPFRAAVRAGVPFVMMSTAIYSHLDPGTPAAFSPKIVTGLLRKQLGFRGVIISDDVGAARQVAAVPVGQRAVRFIAAGGDIVLTVDPSQAGAMASALVQHAKSDTGFAKQVDAAALVVLEAKQARGLLG